jgi:DNA-3-methyladenine glycosylase II
LGYFPNGWAFWLTGPGQRGGPLAAGATRAPAVELATRAPFHLEATVRVLQRRPVNLVDRWDGRFYRRLVPTPGGAVIVEVENCGSIDAPALQLRAASVAQDLRDAAEMVPTVQRLLGLQIDPAPLQQCTRLHPRTASLGIALRGMRPPRFAGLFESMLNVIPFQQLSLDAGVAVVGRLVQRFGETLESQGQRFHAFPTAERVAQARLASLQACGLSLAKARALRELAGQVATGALEEPTLDACDTDLALERLKALPGIGAWTAAVILLRGLGRLDVFPPGDVGAAASLMHLLHLRSPRSLDRWVRRFGRYRGYLYFFGLAGRLLERGLIHAASLESPASSGPDAA